MVVRIHHKVLALACVLVGLVLVVCVKPALCDDAEPVVETEQPAEQVAEPEEVPEPEQPAEHVAEPEEVPEPEQPAEQIAEPEIADQTEQNQVQDVGGGNVRSGGVNLLAATSPVLNSADYDNIRQYVWVRQVVPNAYWSSGDAVGVNYMLTYDGNLSYSENGSTVNRPTLLRASRQAMSYASDNNSKLVTLQADVTDIKTRLAAGGTSGSVTINSDQMDKFVSALQLLSTESLLLLVGISLGCGLLAWRIVSERWRQ